MTALTPTQQKSLKGTASDRKKSQPLAQQSLLSFFGRNGSSPSQPSPNAQHPSTTPKKNASLMLQPTTLTPAKIGNEPAAIIDSSPLKKMEIDEENTLDEKGRVKKRPRYFESDEEEELENPSNSEASRKKLQRNSKRIIPEDDDSEDEYRPAAEGNEQSDDDLANQAENFSDDIEPATKKAPRTPKTPRINGDSALDKLKRFTPSSRNFSSPSASPFSSPSDKRKERAAEFKKKNEERYSWLQDIRDANGNPPESPDYDPRSLYIPPQAWNKFTPFEKQFWEIKSTHWDTVVFFKKGKFFELYEKDADIGHQQFDLKLTDRVNMRMAGVPESSFDEWAAKFIAAGHKVAKVDQMETALAKEMRERGAKGGKEEKVIRRELCSILTAGTLVDGAMITNDMSTYCMAIKESFSNDGVSDPSFGICFVDTSTAEFNLVAFQDDADRTKFETLIMQIKPRELVTEKGMLSPKTIRILKNTLNSPIWNALAPEREFWDERTTADEIRIAGYFKSSNSGGEDAVGDGMVEEMKSWPPALKMATNSPLLMSAAGGLFSYLRMLKLDAELISLGNFHSYDPVRQSSSLILDGQTLANLEVLENNFDGGTEGTLFRLLDHCITPFGKRLFKRWLCHPLRSVSAINNRLDAIEELNSCPELQDAFNARFSRLPDLERLISRIHAGSIKIKDFLNVLGGFERIMKTMIDFEAYSCTFTSHLLQALFYSFPDLQEQLQFFETAFDHEIAAKEGNIIPRPGVEEDWDQICEEIKDLKRQLDKHLNEVKKKLGTSKVVYKDLGKEIYQLEIPSNIKVPSDFIKLSQTKAVNRYWNPTVKELVRQLKEAEETKSNILKSIQGRLYRKFDLNYKDWRKAVCIISEIDCLISLAKASMSLGEPACRPELIEEGESVLEFDELRHPCVVPGVATDFIPNDTHLGRDKPHIILLTGPNMGGKSTLLRQTCVAIIMAQVGCFVPARRCRMTPFDRIFTRIGANDNILAGQSTFMVELSETSKILHEATPRSMVILDELGRGTSTFDGYAIAYSVLHYLATHIGCLGLFSTHYQTLCDEFSHTPGVANMHMSYQVDETNREVTFLYKLTPGACQKSFGMNVASMAGVPTTIVDRADAVAAQFEHAQTLRDNASVLRATAKLSLSQLSDFAYLMRSAAHAVDAEDVGDRAQDNQTTTAKEERQARVFKSIIHAIRQANI
ncbi:uncharacterized protein VTP21DRAFT_9412 [Calcarisporiella thermophila]|uniref:uncharacterized protein n=1 Tax=Calcarisporiella thermophila TaxID=911321 RepID=UPI003743A2C3